MMHSPGVLVLRTLTGLVLLLSTPAWAQTIPLESLWPNQDGLRWTYDGQYEESIQGSVSSDDFTASLTFDGTNSVGGRTVQNLVGRIDGALALGVAGRPAGLDPLSARLWLARPDLRRALVERAARTLNFWPFLLLAPAQDNTGFLQTPTSIGDWRDEIAGQSWLYLVEPKTVGPNFTLQLVPDLADDVFLHGTVTSADESVAGGDLALYPHSWIVEYMVDLGESTHTDELGAPLGTFRMHTTGFVAFSAGIGPFYMEERTKIVEIDCASCPFELDDVVSQGSLALKSLPVATESSTWSQLKAHY